LGGGRQTGCRPQIRHFGQCAEPGSHLTRAYALYLDGMLIPVCNLVNGSTILVYDTEDLSELEYFHVKLESHDVIYAEGAACETLLMVSESAKNFADYYRAHGFPEAEQKPFAPIHSLWGRRSQLASRVRSAVSLIKESRRPLDLVRDRLESMLHRSSDESKRNAATRTGHLRQISARSPYTQSIPAMGASVS
jgi:hypothetical protein